MHFWETGLSFAEEFQVMVKRTDQIYRDNVDLSKERHSLLDKLAQAKKASGTHLMTLWRHYDVLF